MSSPPSRPPLAFGSPSSRSSFMSIRALPIIAEDEEARSFPRIPLRVPQKNPRRSLPQHTPYVPEYMLHSQMVSYKEMAADFSDGSGLGGGKGEVARERWWRWRKWCKTVGILCFSVVLAVALAVGLTIGLRSRSNAKRNSGSGDDDDLRFPAGSFTFDTTLQNTTTSCTSDPSSWRCYPYETGSSAKFFWIISPSPSSPSSSSSGYTISSTNNPFAPSFSNLTTTLHSPNQADERLTFSFNMSKTVTPSDKLDATNRAAKCTFDETVFEATLWTRRGVSGTPETGSKYTAWPGDVEIVQKKEAELGEPKCVDDDGRQIADVQAGSGECECRYASFDLD